MGRQFASFYITHIIDNRTGKEKEQSYRFTRVGFEKMKGYLAGSFEAWRDAGEPIDMIIEVEADELMMDIPHDPHLLVVDVRRETEFADGHLKEAVNIPLNEMTDPAHVASWKNCKISI